MQKTLLLIVTVVLLSCDHPFDSPNVSLVSPEGKLIAESLTELKSHLNLKVGEFAGRSAEFEVLNIEYKSSELWLTAYVSVRLDDGRETTILWMDTDEKSPPILALPGEVIQKAQF